MNPLYSLLLAPVLLPVPEIEGDRLLWRPAEGTQLQRTVLTSENSTKEKSLLSISGNEQDAGTGVERSTQGTIVVHDRFGPPMDGAGPSSVQRTFEQVSEATNIDGIPDGIHVRGGESGEGLLEGKTVAFTFDAESEDYEPDWEEGSNGKIEWLEGLNADMDYSTFLPEEPVNEGDLWKIDLSGVRQLLQPGGKIQIDENDESDPETPEGGLAIVVPKASAMERLEELRGALSATYAGTRKIGGRSLGVIALRWSSTGPWT